MASKGYDIDMMHAMEKVNCNPNFKPINIDDHALINMVEKGLGVTIMPELELIGRSDKVITLPVHPNSYRELGVAPSPTKADDEILTQILAIAKGVAAMDKL